MKGHTLSIVCKLACDAEVIEQSGGVSLDVIQRQILTLILPSKHQLCMMIETLETLSR